MKEVLTYFKAERAESIAFMIVATISILLSSWFWISIKKTFYNGMGTSLAAIAILQIIVGVAIYFRSPLDIKRVENYMNNNPSKIKSIELPRMEKVIHNFVTYRYMEISLAIAGLALTIFFRDPAYWKGLGAGLFVQALLMLLFNYFAESRGKVYLEFLRTFNE